MNGIPENVTVFPDVAIRWCPENAQDKCKMEKFTWKNKIPITGLEACTLYKFEVKLVVQSQVDRTYYNFSKDSVNFEVYSWSPEYYPEDDRNNLKNITSENNDVKIDDLGDYKYYFVRLTGRVSPKRRINETSPSVSSDWIKVGPTAPGSLLI
ncbi:hypothetical protein Ciccas_009920 [Cichlidogyrus casuarinus]|uniref:Uncharacterized protein n=1 Tax=Cichlidogyrus casuarinus TaxID=1844966 RepID=A0ABD2PW45_9PLAT